MTHYPSSRIYRTDPNGCCLSRRRKVKQPVDSRDSEAAYLILALVKKGLHQLRNYIGNVRLSFGRGELDRYSKLVDKEEIVRNGYNLNIRRYVNNTPEPEPEDVRAHLLGGVDQAPVRAIGIARGLGFDSRSSSCGMSCKLP